ncbi:hypothetical protein Droror1_Dr00020071 [Drosera rotundifolia]
MQAENNQKTPGEKLRAIGKPPAAGGALAKANSRRSGAWSSANRVHPSSGTGGGYMVPYYQLNQKMRAQEASREILMRALSPPRKRVSWRWRFFQPTPSRLSTMSAA